MHGMSEDTPRMSDTPTEEKPVSIFDAATLAEVAFASAVRRASKRRDRGKWSAKYEADLTRCREAIADIKAAIQATTERFHADLEADLRRDNMTSLHPHPAPMPPEAGEHCGWASSAVDRRSRRAITANLHAHLAADERVRDSAGQSYVSHLRILASLPAANIHDIAVKLAHALTYQTACRPPAGFDGDTAEYCLVAGALADLVLLRGGEVRPTED